VTIPPGTEPIPRKAARVLLIDASDRVLLFRGLDPARPEHRYWFTVGGGLDEGETAAEGAARELREETGLEIEAGTLIGPVWREFTEFPFDGQWYRQEQEFFLCRVPQWTVSTAGFNEIENESIDGHRWWSLPELETTSERYYPRDLPVLLRRMLLPSADGDPSAEGE
jgi:8-oxo-dGTP pyrophosphatase MutT (NUDIX family)